MPFVSLVFNADITETTANDNITTNMVRYAAAQDKSSHLHLLL